MMLRGEIGDFVGIGPHGLRRDELLLSGELQAAAITGGGDGGLNHHQISFSAGHGGGDTEKSDLYSFDPNDFDRRIHLSPLPPSSTSSSSTASRASDIVFKYISELLMEENSDEEDLEPSAALQATEKSLYDVLFDEQPPPPHDPAAATFSSGHSSSGSVDGFSGVPSVTSGSWVHGESLEGQFAWQFQRGIEEAKRFLPTVDDGFSVIGSGGRDFGGSIRAFEVINGAIYRGGHAEEVVSKGRKNLYGDEDSPEEEQRSSKQPAVSVSDDSAATVGRSEMFDKVLLRGEYDRRSWRERLESDGTEKKKPEGGARRRSRGKSRPAKKKGGVVDLQTILVHCAQAVMADDRRSAGELLRQVRRHASPSGDGAQRLAHFFADGLEARLAGTGGRIYHSLVSKRRSAADVLRAYQLYFAASPFMKTFHAFANRAIVKLAESSSSKLHIVDYGIHYGFQWPCFMQLLSQIPGGPPKLKITGIEAPLPGFRPSEIADETERRLADYAQSFGIEFEYNPVTAKWEDVTAGDIGAAGDELVVVNCMYRLHMVADETVAEATAAEAASPRDSVLATMRGLKPELFVMSLVNGSFSAPFFVTRFREALFFYATVFDLLEANVPEREDPERLVLEKELIGRDIVNVVACEGAERVQRPETYKQWQGRISRAGFEQLPMKEEMVKQVKVKVKEMYHKDFVVEKDGQWLLQGWKGRITHAFSYWKADTAADDRR